jgi:hypothetical protein
LLADRIKAIVTSRFGDITDIADTQELVGVRFLQITGKEAAREQASRALPITLGSPLCRQLQKTFLTSHIELSMIFSIESITKTIPRHYK